MDGLNKISLMNGLAYIFAYACWEGIKFFGKSLFGNNSNGNS